MKLLIQIFILVVFLKTGNLLSENNLFSVNNILLEKKDDITNKQLTNKAISEAFDKLINRILLKEDVQNFSSLDILKKKELVSYYNISKNSEGEKDKLILMSHLIEKKCIVYFIKKVFHIQTL